MNSAFLSRECCPACRCTSSQKLYATRFSVSPISDYLDAFYASQGGIDLSALEGGDYVLVECLGCGLIFQRYVLSDRLMCRLYEEWIDPIRSLAIYEAETGMAHVLDSVRQIADLIQFMGQPPAQIKVLDYGMGWGHWCRIASTFALDVYGLELSQAKIVQAQNKGVTSISTEDLQHHSFDFINIEQVLEHLPDPLQTLSNLVRNLRPGGLVRIGVPDGWNIKKRLKAVNWQASKSDRYSLNPIAPLEHVNCFNHSSLISMARRAGLEPISIPSHHAFSCIGRVRSLLRPLYYALRGSDGTTQYFRRSS